VFDFRYHVASLAAVLLALAVGVLLGVAISGKVSDTQESAQRAVNEQLRQDLQTERERTAAGQERGETAEELFRKAYPALMEGRLAGKRFAVLFLGGVDGDLRSAVEQTLSEADSGSPAGTPTRLTALDLPIDPEALDEVLANRRELARFSGDHDFGDLGRELGRDLIEGEAEIWSAVLSALVLERSGTPSLEVEGAIVIRSWVPAEAPEGEQESRLAATETLVDGLLDGLDSAGVPVVGVEATSTAPEQSAIALYRERGLSSVDDIDTQSGRLALSLLLAGGEPGHYGVKDSATNGITPPIEPVPAETAGE
jgi:copper transport outer membrane protein MctB